MSDMPDFDNMSPEEMMEWMESLAKRQGASEGLTTEASMDVAEVSADDERLADTGEYIPYGWSKERWEEQQAKESAERAAREAAEQVTTQAEPVAPPEPTAPPAPEPVAEQPAAVAGGEPDFDSMSPEELMAWMETLAVRQGADEGLTTSADMEVAEISADDERLADTGEYIPYGWSKERWEEQQAKEAAERAAKQAQEPAAQAEPVAPPEPAAPPAPEPVAEQPAAAAGGEPDFDSMSPEELMKWMETLAVNQGATEGLTTSADMEIAEVSADDERLADAGEYIPYGWSEERWREQQEKEAAERAAKQAQASEPVAADEEELAAALEGDVLEAPSLDDIFSGANVIGDDDEDIEEFEFDEEEAFGDVLEAPSMDDLFAGMDLDASDDAEEEELPAAEPMDWLAGLSGDTPSEGMEMPDFDLDALGDLAGGDSDAMPDFDLSALGDLAGGGEEASSDDPLSWLSGLAGDEPVAEAADDDEEGSLEWMESLAAKQGADEEELITDADLDLSFPADLEETGPGYTPFSFEEATGMGLEDTDDELEMADMAELGLDDPESWLDSIASGVAESADDDTEEPAIPEDYEETTQDVMGRLNSGADVSPEEMEDFFKKQFQKAATMPEPELDDDDDIDVPDAIEAEIPDWLQETMSTTEMAAVDEESLDLTDGEPEKTATAEMMAAALGLDDDGANDLPDWLSADADQDTGQIAADIFEEIIEEEERPSAAELQIDTNDSWVEAFVQEEEQEGELADWYNTELARRGDTDEVTAQPAASLQAADLPLEMNLPAGTPQALPEWLGGGILSTTDNVETVSVEVDEMSWLSTDETEAIDSDMPDWLRDTVDDTVTEGEDVPEWLATEGLEDLDIEDVPDWLRETLDEEQAAATYDDAEDFLLEEAVEEDYSDIFTMEEEEPVAATPPPAAKPAPTPQPAPKKSPAPIVPVNIDVAATLQSAQQKLKNDIDGALLDYEALVRANAELDKVASDLTKASEQHKKHPAVFRVLGDTLMRQGKLQDALNTYRKALNML